MAVVAEAEVAAAALAAASRADSRWSAAPRSTEELIAGTQRGILVTHFFYIRSLDQRTVLLTGLTRDGTFLIENGKITAGLKNFRWNESPLFMLNKIDEIGRAERTAAGSGDAEPSREGLQLHFTFRRRLKLMT